MAMTTLAFCIGAAFAILGIALVFSHKDEVPLPLRALSFALGVAPGAVGARLALAHRLPESFLLDALALLCLLFAARIVAREHRRERAEPATAAAVKGRVA